jgi:ABC-2 type transport system permease protein
MIRALLYLRLTSLRNYVAFRVRRLRQPKYLVGAAVAAFYLYFVLLRRSGLSGLSAAGSPDAAAAGQGIAAVLCVLVAGLALARIALAWMVPADKAGLRFSEPEIAFLFPAPISRKTLIHFRLLSGQLAILFTSVLMVFFFRRFGSAGGNRVTHAIGWWVILSVSDLSTSGTSLTIARLKETAGRVLLWRIVVVAAIALYVAAVVWFSLAYVNSRAGGLADFKGMSQIADGFLASSPLKWLLLPFRLIFGPYFAPGPGEFALAMIPALGVLALLYYWVSNTEAHFEEGSIALAEKRAALKAAALSGERPQIGLSKPKARSGPFPLAPVGPPEVAFLWKNLLSMRSSLLTRRTVMLFLWILFVASFSLKPVLAQHARASGGDVYGAMIVLFCGIVAGYTLLLGPQIARQDLRNDLPNMDLLKTYPIEGWRLALGELLAPAALLSLILWVCILVCAFAVDSRGVIEWLTPAVRVTAAVCLALAAPFLCLIQLIVPNTLMVLLPGWYQASRSRGGGIELMGQRMILGLGQLLIALAVAAPAAGTAVLIIIASSWVFGGAVACILATLAVMAILAGEAAVGLWWLGEKFAKFDLSSESR